MHFKSNWSPYIVEVLFDDDFYRIARTENEIRRWEDNA